MPRHGRPRGHLSVTKPQEDTTWPTAETARAARHEGAGGARTGGWVVGTQAASARRSSSRGWLRGVTGVRDEPHAEKCLR